jgi:TonB family protein
MRGLIGIVAAIALFPSNAAAQRLIELDPDSTWVVNYDDDSCALQRQFGPQGGQVFLELRRFGAAEDFQVIVASKDYRRRNAVLKIAFRPFEAKSREVLSFEINFDDGQKGALFSYNFELRSAEIEAAYQKFVEASTSITDSQKALLSAASKAYSEDRIREFIRYTEDPEYLAAASVVIPPFLTSEGWRSGRDNIEREAEGLLLERAFDRSVMLRTGELHTPMQAMRTCIDELYSHWGIDVEAHRSLLRPATPIDFNSLRSRVAEHYPAEMARSGRQGFLRVRLGVSADGSPTECHMQTPINHKAFEKQACDALMQHARFSPALDKGGQPIASFYQTAIVYTLSAR